MSTSRPLAVYHFQDTVVENGDTITIKPAITFDRALSSEEMEKLSSGLQVRRLVNSPDSFASI
jgi:hypothetical protein